MGDHLRFHCGFVLHALEKGTEEGAPHTVNNEQTNPHSPVRGRGCRVPSPSHRSRTGLGQTHERAPRD
jgi:hypothetical protein